MVFGSATWIGEMLRHIQSPSTLRQGSRLDKESQFLLQRPHPHRSDRDHQVT